MSPDSHPIVVGYDDSEQSHDALAFAVALALATGDRILLTGAYGPDDPLRPEVLDRRRDQVLEQLDRAADAAATDEVAIEYRAVTGGSAAAALQTVAEAEHPRAVVLGSCHRGPAGRVLAGSVADRLLYGAPCPVVVAPRGLAAGGSPELRTVCVGFDGSSEAWTALQRAAQVAVAAGAHLRVATAIPPLAPAPPMAVYPAEFEEERTEAAQVGLERAVESVSAQLHAEPQLLRGVPAQRLADEAAEGADLLVLGSRGYGPLKRVLLGSVSTAVMRSAACPVMIVPRTAEFDSSAAGLAGADETVSSA